MQGTQNTSGFRTFTATAVAIAAFVRVKVDSAGLILVAGATDDWVGVTQVPIAASGSGPVRLRTAAGSFLVTVSEAVAAGAPLYAAASGKVSDTGGVGPLARLVALEAATADGDIIEAAPSDAVIWTAAAAQAVATDATSVITLANALRTAAINAGIIKGAA